MKKANKIEEKGKIGHRRREEEREEKKREIFPTFRLSNLDGPRIKFKWVPKSGSFFNSKK